MGDIPIIGENEAVDPELQRLLDEEEEIERRLREATPAEPEDDTDDDPELAELKAEFNTLTAENQATLEELAKFGYAIGPNEIIKLQMRVLVELLTETPADRMRIEVATQQALKNEVELVMEQIKATQARQMLTEGVDAAMQGVDLSALKEGNRAQRRAAMKRLQKG